MIGTVKQTTTGGTIQNQYIPMPYQHPCPSCGRCPTCGRGGYYQPLTYPYWNTLTNQPYFYEKPHVTCNAN